MLPSPLREAAPPFGEGGIPVWGSCIPVGGELHPRSPPSGRGEVLDSARRILFGRAVRPISKVFGPDPGAAAAYASPTHRRSLLARGGLSDTWLSHNSPNLPGRRRLRRVGRTAKPSRP